MTAVLTRKDLWNALPSVPKQVIGKVLGKLPFDRVLGREFRSTRNFLKRAQWWSKDQNVAFQVAQLRRVLMFAGAHSPHYRDLFTQMGFNPAEIKSPEDIHVLPMMDKNTVLEKLLNLMTCSPKSPGLDFISTGGTSGAPLAFYAPKHRSSTEYAYLTTSWERSGYQIGDTMAVLRGRVLTDRRNGFRHEHDPLLRHHYYSNFHLNEHTGMSYLAHMGTLGPCVLHAYPSAAATLARIALQHPCLIPNNVKAVLLESENVYPDQSDLIQKAFGVPPFSCYGHSEKLVLAAGCEDSDDYHVWPSYGYFELIDELGKAITTPGQRGEIVGTGFINTVLPMVRYRTGDYATYGGDRCECCGRNHVVLRDIEGRWPQGNLIANDGSAVSMTSLNMHDDCLRRVLDYQYVQDEPGRARMLVTAGEGWTDNDRRRIQESVNRRLQSQVEVTVDLVPEIFRTGRGKLSRVVSSSELASYARVVS